MAIFEKNEWKKNAIVTKDWPKGTGETLFP